MPFNSGGKAGQVHVLEWEQIPSSDLRPVSGHGIGVKEALLVCRKLYPERAAEYVYLVGVEGICFDRVGAGLSPQVSAALESAEHALLALIEKSQN